MDDELARRLNRIEAIFRLAFSDALTREGERVRSHKVDGPLVDGCEGDWVGSGPLQKQVAQATDTSERHVRERLLLLTSRGVLERRGAGRAVEYRSTGLI
jgi:hypothetical protein